MSGGVLSPLNSVLLSLERDGGNVVNYADDVAIVVKVMFPSTLRGIMQTAKRELRVWR